MHPRNGRNGTAFWLSDDDGDLVRTIAAAEDRTIQTVIMRAIRHYATLSPEYQQWLAEKKAPVPRPTRVPKPRPRRSRAQPPAQAHAAD